jgi:hypothetical protein
MRLKYRVYKSSMPPQSFTLPPWISPAEANGDLTY